MVILEVVPRQEGARSDREESENSQTDFLSLKYGQVVTWLKFWGPGASSGALLHTKLISLNEIDRSGRSICGIMPI